MRSHQYLVSYNLDIGKDKHSSNGWGSIHITVKKKWWKRGYEAKDLHTTRVLIAGVIRKRFKIPTNKRVGIVIMNITRFPI